jgi:hypothetical protein
MTQPVPTRTHALTEDASGESGGESTGTVVVAGLANLGIAVAKLVGGLISHSSAMLSEAAHSLAGRSAPGRLRPGDLLLGAARLPGHLHPRCGLLLLPGRHDHRGG